MRRGGVGLVFLTVMGEAAFVFVGTNLDNLMLLVMFFSDRRFTARQIVIGNCVAGLALVVGGLVCGMAAYDVPAGYMRWMGAVPVGVGIWQLGWLIWGKRGREEEIPRGRSWKVLAVAAVCMSHGADNVAAYGALFATSSAGARLGIVVVFVAMIGLFTGAGRGLVQHPAVGRVLRRAVPVATPVVLIGLGVWIFLGGVHR